MGRPCIPPQFFAGQGKAHQCTSKRSPYKFGGIYFKNDNYLPKEDVRPGTARQGPAKRLKSKRSLIMEIIKSDKWEGLVPQKSIDLVSAKIVDEEVGRIKRKHDGLEFLEQVVKSAKERSSPLYKYFEWNDEKAGDKFRALQAGYLIHTVKVVMSQAAIKKPVTVPRAIVRSSAPSTSYRKQKTSEDLKNELIEEFFDDFNRLYRKHESLKELGPIFKCYQDLRNDYMEGKL